MGDGALTQSTTSRAECRVLEGPTEDLAKQGNRIEPVISLVTKALLALGYDEKMADMEEILLSVRAGLGAGVPLAEAMAHIWSDVYACPGGHWSRKLTYQEDEANAGHHCLRDGEVVFIEGRPPEGVYFIQQKECPESITVTLEWETDDMGGSKYCYPVADGPCVEALGYDDERFYDSQLLAKWEERARLRNLLEGSTTRRRIWQNQIARAAQAEQRREEDAEREAERKVQRAQQALHEANRPEGSW